MISVEVPAELIDMLDEAVGFIFGRRRSSLVVDTLVKILTRYEEIRKEPVHADGGWCAPADAFLPPVSVTRGGLQYGADAPRRRPTRKELRQKIRQLKAQLAAPVIVSVTLVHPESDQRTTQAMAVVPGHAYRASTRGIRVDGWGRVETILAELDVEVRR